MKKCLLFYVTVLILSSSVFAQAGLGGGTDGGGGRGVVCYVDANQKVIESVELLDFFEGRLLEGYNLPEQHGDFKEIYKETIKKAASKSILRMMEYGDMVLKGFKFLPTGVRLNPVDDSSEIFIPANCKIEQVVNFQGMSRIFVVKDFWDRLTETSRAGLLMHELIWFYERNAGAEKSSRARRTVARFFADNYDFGKINLNPKVGDYSCSASNPNHTTNNITTGNSFYLSKIPNSESCELNFTMLNGTMVYTEQKAVLDYCDDINFDLETTTSEDESEFTTTLEVISTNDRILSHHMTLVVDIEPGANGTLLKRLLIQVTNREFPGYDEKLNQLYCHKLTEQDINDRWWDK